MFGALSAMKFPDNSEENRIFILETYRHLKKCGVCTSGYLSLKADLATDPERGVYTPEDFKLIRENEEFLDRTIA